MKVSRAKQIVSTVGYKLDIEFNDKKNAVKEVLGYTLILPKKLQDNLEKGILKKEEQNKNLRFLKEFLSRNSISKRKLAKAIGMSAGAVETWFNTDDVAISYLYRIKEAYKVDISFIITEKGDSPNNAE